MPQIPLTQRPDLIQTAPAGRFMNGNAFQAAPIQAREYISPGAGVNALGRGVAGALDAGAEFFKKAQESTDYIATQEAHRFARNQIDAFHADLQNRTDYENFSKDYQEKLKSVEEGVQPFLDKASNPAKMMFQQQFSDLTEGAAVRTRAFANQRRVTNDKAVNNGFIDDAIEREDLPGAEAALNKGVQLGYYMPAELEQKKRSISTEVEFVSARKIIDKDNDPEMREKLLAKDDKGEFVNWKGITVKNRDRLANYADKKYTEYSNALMPAMAVKLDEGELSHEEIDSSKLSKDDKAKLHRAVFKYDEELMKRVNNESVKADEDLIKFNTNAVELKIHEYDWSNDESERAKQVKEWQGKVYALELPAKETRTTLEYLERKSKESFAYQRDYTYKLGKKMISDAANIGIQLPEYQTSVFNPKSWFTGGKIKLITDPDGMGNKKASTQDQIKNLVTISRWWDSYYKDHPEIKENDVEEIIQGKVRSIYTGVAVENLQNEFAPKTGKPDTSAAVNLATPSAPPAGKEIKETYTAKDGCRMIIYADGTKEIRSNGK